MLLKFNEYSHTPKIYYHGSMDDLPIGTILRPSESYATDWGSTDFYNPLEKYRPKDKPPHHNSVFMCEDEDDIDASGGGTSFIFTVKPLGPVDKHDLNWSSEISMLVSDGESEEKIKQAAKNYWRGVPHNSGESLWEYTTTHAEILTSEPY